MQPDLTPTGYEFLSHNSQPKRHSSVLTVMLLAFFILLSLSLTLFGFWAFTGRQEYKNKTDKITAKAVEAAKQQVAVDKEKEFVEKEKSPFKEYKGPSTYGSLGILYPKTWSGFVSETARASIPVEGYFHPGVVPGLQSGTSFALRVQVTSQPYDVELQQFEQQAKAGKVKISPYKAPKVQGTLGARIEGEINTNTVANQKGIVVLFPIRDKTLKISTESEQFRGDFDNVIMANLTFVP